MAVYDTSPVGLRTRTERDLSIDDVAESVVRSKKAAQRGNQFIRRIIERQCKSKVNLEKSVVNYLISAVALKKRLWVKGQVFRKRRHKGMPCLLSLASIFFAFYYPLSILILRSPLPTI
jgi:hypothetical protein